MTIAILLALLGWLPAPPVSKAEPSPAQAAFGRLKILDGSWTAVSTKGWSEELQLKVIAGGSAVLETSVGAHPNETMATVYYMDGARLLLTHYCVAKNQPRLQATVFEREGQDVTFTFLDATNLPSRDHGHMDKVVLHFTDENHFSSRWTWFENGHEQWLEVIEATRKMGHPSAGLR
jgi:hypothetical protein